ncbi:MAG: hypothetical protein P1U56_22160 [Saprospiraceae bacterium]|nr:hypothetical protein [Saprospiraceae bacterium]
MNKKPFLPIDFEVPQELETNRLRLRMLKVSDVVKDYDAVMSSVEHLQTTIPFGPNHNWPQGLTIEQNLIDLGWHQKEFQRRSSFAYTVMNLEESKCLGCIYIDPSTNPNYEAMVVLWVRQSEIENGLDPHLFESVKEWISEKWPFKKIAYPGREISWEEWFR